MILAKVRIARALTIAIFIVDFVVSLARAAAWLAFDFATFMGLNALRQRERCLKLRRALSAVEILRLTRRRLEKAA